MRLLIVAMSESIHTARWIKQVTDQGWDIHLFSSVDNGILHPAMTNITVYHSVYALQKEKEISVKLRGLPLFYKPFATLARKMLKKFFPKYRAVQLGRLINKLKPHIIHSLEIQHAGYLLLESRKYVKNRFPVSIITNWGSDISLFGRLTEHEPRIRAVLESADYYSCECERDVDLARHYGFKGEVLPVFPNTGGFDLETISKLRSDGAVSKRKKIMLKGYQGWAGRALVGLRALERCSDILAGYEVVIYSASKTVLMTAELLSNSIGVQITIIPQKTPHYEILKLHGEARISIGLSISDAISTSFLESIVMGSFPIQSWTACADEWIEDGRTGILVPPDDPEIIEAAIRLALTDDDLVDQAAEENSQTCRERLGYDFIKSKAIELYLTVAQEENIQYVI
ncbi:glycosyltransferase [Thermodesulfobacteriota bacterium]